ncbi:unnamed protein product [Ophioblennius macclurei]
MAGCGEKRDAAATAAAADAAVIIVENEAESMPVHDERRLGSSPAASPLDTCPVCQLNFHSREPKLLPCLHSFCRKCLPSPSRNLATAEAPNFHADSAIKPLNVIRCPVCRQECMEVDVMENVFVKDSAEAPSSTVEKAVQLCMTCDDNTEAAGFCVDCVEYLCATCVEAHQRVKFTKDHTIRQKTGVSPEVRSVSTPRPMFCDVHKQEPLKLFCETCDLLTCRDCQLVKHKDHNYQFLEDAYKNHKQHMENMTHQLQEKRKLIEEVSNSINNGLVQVDQNRTSVHNEIKKSVCSLILEINKKGKMLLTQLESVTKDHESVLRKQQEDIGYLSRHLDHVISFTKWATARNGGTALLYCKRLILFQIGNLLRAKCSASFVPQSTVRFQCRASYWASNVDLGSLMVENVPGHQLGGFQGFPHQLTHPSRGPSGSPHSFALGGPNSTLAQLQMQVDKLNPQPHWQPQPPPPPHPPHPPWTWYQSVRLPRTVLGPHQGGGSPSQNMPPPQSGRRFMAPPPNHASPTGSLPSPGFPPQHHVRMMGSSSSYQTKPIDGPLCAHVPSLPLNTGISLSQSRPMMESTYVNRRNDPIGPLYMMKPNYPQGLPLQARNGYTAVSQEEKPGTASWKPEETHQMNGSVGSAVKRRRRSSPGPVIVIKDEPDDDSSYTHARQTASLPDSTNDQLKISSHSEGKVVPTPISPLDQSTAKSLNHPKRSEGEEEQQADQTGLRSEESNEVLCAVCQTGGDLSTCHKCLKVFHLTCHVPSLLKSPSGEWFCSFCRDLLVPEMEYDCKDESKPGARTVKMETDSEGGICPVEKRKCERLLLLLFCAELGSDFQESASPSVCARNGLTIKGSVNLSTVKKRLEAEQSLSYQSSAEFVSDVRLVFGNKAMLSESDSKRKKCRELFEEHLKAVYPDQTFPEIKVEAMPAAPTDTEPSSLDNTTQIPKRQRMCSDSQDAPNRPNGIVGIV